MERRHPQYRVNDIVPDHEEIKTDKKAESSPTVGHQGRPTDGQLLLLHTDQAVPEDEPQVRLGLGIRYDGVRGQLETRHMRSELQGILPCTRCIYKDPSSQLSSSRLSSPAGPTVRTVCGTGAPGSGSDRWECWRSLSRMSDSRGLQQPSGGDSHQTCSPQTPRTDCSSC